MRRQPKAHKDLRRSWNKMLYRCRSDSNKYAPNYKDRGISVCERWLVFENFAADMGPVPEGKTIDRIDNDGNYEPGNCRWADRLTQARNRRFVRPLTLNGRTQLLTDWATELGTKPQTISMRLDVYHWPIERALTTPVRRQT